LTTKLNSVQSTLASTQEELASTKQTLASSQLTLTSTLTELGATTSTLTATRFELSSTKDTLTSTRSELSATKNTLTSTQLVLNTTNQTLFATQSELATTRQTLATAQQASSSLTATLTNTQQKLAVAQETLKGLGISILTSMECSDVVLIDNSAAKNPTWSQLMSFLAQDKTENHTYIANVYDCSQFSLAVHNNAEAAGIRAAEVQVTLKGESAGHAFNAFLTTDYGLVYVDCTEAPDRIAHAITGKEFRAVDVNWIAGTNFKNDSWWDSLSSYYYMGTNTGGHAVVSGIKIFW
jgi:hypothetical protein